MPNQPSQNTSAPTLAQPQVVSRPADFAAMITELVAHAAAAGVVAALEVTNREADELRARLAEVEDELNHPAHHVLRHQHAAGRLPGFARRPRPRFADGGPGWPVG